MVNTVLTRRVRANKRPIVATWYHGKQAVKTRFFVRISTAFPRMLQLLMENGYQGDVVEFASTEFGYQIGTVKLTANGAVNIQWTIEEH